MESMAVVMPEVEGHPNRAAFRGVLTVVDAPSQRAPSGSGGRRVVLTKEAAEAALPSLIPAMAQIGKSFARVRIACTIARKPATPIGGAVLSLEVVR